MSVWLTCRRGVLALGLVGLPMLGFSLGVAGCDLLDHSDDSEASRSTAGKIQSHSYPMTLDETGLVDGDLSAAAVQTPTTYLPAVVEEYGGAPVSVQVLKIEVLPVVSSADGVGAWADLFAGEVALDLVPGGTQRHLTIGRFTASGGLADQSLTILLTRDDLDNEPELAAGNFSIVLGGAAAPNLPSSFSLDVNVRVEYWGF